jgi:PDZ domain-containing secreted protein
MVLNIHMVSINYDTFNLKVSRPPSKLEVQAKEDIQYVRNVFLQLTIHSAVSAVRELQAPVQITAKPMIQSISSKIKIGQVFNPSDVILAVDGVEIKSLNEYYALRYSWNLKYGDKHVYTVLRDGYTLQIPITFNVKEGPNLVTGISVYDTITEGLSADVSDLFNYDSALQGNSSGLMITLELVQQMLGSDLTKGYKIAGTVTTELDGKVGPVSSIEEKIKTADKEKVKIIFYPNFIQYDI